MKQERTDIPHGGAVSRPWRRGLRFITKEIEQRIREANEERRAKDLLRASRRKALANNSRLAAELQKVESIIRLRDSLLLNLAKHENIL